MDELKNQETQDETQTTDYELNHTDKLVGVFTEPGTMFGKTSKFPPKAIDWLIPIVLLIVVAALSNILMMSNPKIKYDVVEKQMARFEEDFQEQVKKGEMTQEQADERLDQMREQMEQFGGVGMILQIVGIVAVTFILFFIISGVFFLTAKFGLKGDGTYSSSMVAYGLPYYISVIQVIIMVILALSMDKFFASTSIAQFVDIDTKTFGGFLLGKLDIFSIWFYAIVSIGYAKMFKSASYGKYFAMIFGWWLGFSILMFFAAQAIPFLKYFMM